MAEPAGAVFWNMLYPGHIHLPVNSSYPAVVDGLNCVLVIVDHHEPVVVTDFDNDLVTRRNKSGAHSQLKKPVPYRPNDTVAVDFHAVGNPVQQHAFWTKVHLYQVYRKQSFTEITVGIECQAEDRPESQNLGVFRSAVDRFIQLYRVAAIDPKAGDFDQLESNSLVVRRCFVTYRDKRSVKNPKERMLAALPQRFPQVVLFRIQEFAEDAARLSINRDELAVRVRHHFEAGTIVSESQNALLNCFALLKKSKNYRYAVIDAFSVAEVVAFDLIAEAGKMDAEVRNRYDKLQGRNGRVTIHDAITSFLPQIFRNIQPKFPDLIGNLDRCRKLRHSAMHERAISNAREAELVLNTAQQLIFAVEEWHGESTAI